MATVEQVRLEIDSTKAVQGAKAYEDALNRAARTTDQLDRELIDTEKRIKGSGDAFSRLEKELRRTALAATRQVTETRKMSQAIGRMERAVLSSATAMDRLGVSTARAGRNLGRVGASAAAQGAGLSALTGPATRIAALFGGGLGARAAINSLASFEKTIATVGTVTNATSSQLEALSRQARDLGGTTEFTATEAGEGLLFLARAGFSVEEALSALPRTLDLATAGALQLGEASDIASNVLNQFRLSVAELARVNDVLVNVSNNSNTNIQQLAEALKFVGPVAGALGQEIEGVASAIGVLSDAGIQASLAGTNLRGIFGALSSTGPDVSAALVDIEADLRKLNPATSDVVEILRELERANLDAATAFDVFGRRNAGAVLTLVAGVDSLEEKIRITREQADVTETAAAAIRNTLSGSIDTLKSTLEAATLATGEEGLSGGLRDVVDGATETIRKLFDLESVTDDFGAKTDIAATAIEAFALALALQGGASFLGFLGRAASGLGNLTRSLVLAATAQKALNVATSASLWGVAATAIAGVGFALRTLARDTDDATLAFERNKRAREELAKDVERVAASARKDPLGDSIEAQASRIENRIEDVENLIGVLDRLSAGELGQGRDASLVDRYFGTPQEFDDRVKRLQSLEALVKKLDDEVARGQLDPKRRKLVLGIPLTLFGDGEGGVPEEIEQIRSQLQAPFEVAGREFVPIDAYRKRLEQLGVAGDDLAAAISAASEALGPRFRGEVVATGDLLDILKGRVTDLRDDLQGLRDQAPGVSQDDLTTLGIKSFENSGFNQADALLARADALQAISDGTTTFEAVQSSLAAQLETTRRVEAFVRKEREEGLQVTEDAIRAVRAEIRAQVEFEQSLDASERALRLDIAAKQNAVDAADQLAESMQDQIDVLTGVDVTGKAVETVIARLTSVFGEGSDQVAEYTQKLRELAKELGETESAGSAVSRGGRPQRSQFGDGEAGLQDFIDGQIAFALATREQRRDGVAEQELLRSGVLSPSQDQIGRVADKLEELEDVERLAAQIDTLSDSLANAVGDAVTAFATGAGDLKDIGAQLLADIQQVAVEALISEPLKEQLSNLLGDLLRTAAQGAAGSANGNAFTAGGIVPFASGGIVDNPTLFGFGGGRLGLMGEAGPEAILPLERGRNGKLGVKGGSPITYAPRFSVVVNGGGAAGMQEALKKSSRMMARDFQRRARGLN